MTHDFAAAIRRATALTRTGDLGAATRLIQAALGGRGDRRHDAPSGPPPMAPRLPAPQRFDRTATDATAMADDLGTASEVRMSDLPAGEASTASGAATTAPPRLAAGPLARLRRSLGETVRGLGAARRSFETAPGGGAAAPDAATVPVPAGAQYLSRHHAGAAGARAYRLYVPACAADGLQGLVLMLHGCQQNPDDFAIGTRANAQAEAAGMLVVYPEQPASANPSRCWNWFSPQDQVRGRGEPAILAGMVQAVAAEFGIPAGRIFVAGLSAGGAMAAILADAYPDLFAAAAIHSGLPAGSASDVVSAFAAMRGSAGTAGSGNRGPADAVTRLIVFHGSADRTVHPANGAAIVAARGTDGLATTLHDERSARGRAYRRIVHRRPDGVAALEHWVLDGAGHAWSGGDPSGSYTDPTGPDASAEMMRFFREAAD